MQRSPRALDQASVLPRTVVSLVQSSVLGTSHWGNYAQCAQGAVGHRPAETPPNPQCCRQTIGVAGIAQACPGMMLTRLLLQKKKTVNALLDEAQHLHAIGHFLQYDAQGLPHSGLWHAVFPAETMCWCFWSLFYHLPYSIHSFLRRRRPRRTFLVTNIPRSLELVDQTSNGCSRRNFCSKIDETVLATVLQLRTLIRCSVANIFQVTYNKETKMSIVQKMVRDFSGTLYIYIYIYIYINVVGEGWLEFPDLWSRQNPDGTDI